MDQKDMEYQKKLIQLVISTGDEKQTIEFEERNRAQRQIEVCIAERIGEILLFLICIYKVQVRLRLQKSFVVLEERMGMDR